MEYSLQTERPRAGATHEDGPFHRFRRPVSMESSRPSIGASGKMRSRADLLASTWSAGVPLILRHGAEHGGHVARGARVAEDRTIGAGPWQSAGADQAAVLATRRWADRSSGVAALVDPAGLAGGRRIVRVQAVRHDPFPTRGDARRGRTDDPRRGSQAALGDRIPEIAFPGDDRHQNPGPRRANVCPGGDEGQEGGYAGDHRTSRDGRHPGLSRGTAVEEPGRARGGAGRPLGKGEGRGPGLAAQLAAEDHSGRIREGGGRIPEGQGSRGGPRGGGEAQPGQYRRDAAR